jgi:hypothetical protein
MIMRRGDKTREANRTQIKDYRLRSFPEHSINDQEDNGADGGDENPAEVE